MAIDDYPRPIKQAPSRIKSAEKLEEEEQLSKDIKEFLKRNEVKQGSPLYTKEQYKGLSDNEKKAKSKYVRTVSYGSF